MPSCNPVSIALQCGFGRFQSLRPNRHEWRKRPVAVIQRFALQLTKWHVKVGLQKHRTSWLTYISTQRPRVEKWIL